MMKITGSSITSAFRVDDNKVVGSSSAWTDSRRVGGSDVSRKTTMSKNQTKSRHLEEPKFLTSRAREAFNYLRQVFIEVLILWHFDLEYHTRIETNISWYTIGGVLSQVIPDQLTLDETIKSTVDRHLMAYFSRKIILAEIQYKTNNNELLAIVEVFKTW